MTSGLKSVAPGLDGVTTEVLKVAADYIAAPLCNIINLSLSQGVFLDLLKSAKVTPIHKGGSINNLNNYRPVSVLLAISKLFELSYHRQLIGHLESDNLLHPHQYGFRQGKGTDFALRDLWPQWHWDWKRGKVL